MMIIADGSVMLCTCVRACNRTSSEVANREYGILLLTVTSKSYPTPCITGLSRKIKFSLVDRRS